MKRIVWDMTKVMIIFIGCTCLFYFGLRAMHDEYEQYHRYDQPSGPAMKVFGAEEEDWLEQLQIFLRLGE